MKRIAKALLIASVLILPLAGSSAAESKGLLGVQIREVPEALASHLNIEHGIMIDEVLAQGAAEQAGVERLDVVVMIDGNDEPAQSLEAFVKEVRSHQAADTIVLTVRRGTESLDIPVTLGQAAGKANESEPRPPASKIETPAGPGFLGIRFGPVPESLATHLSLGENRGVMITEVLADSPAEEAGIQKSDVILAVNGKTLDDSTDLGSIISQHSAGDSVRITLLQKGKKRTVSATLGTSPAPSRGFPQTRGTLDFFGQKLDFQPRSRLRGKFRYHDEDGKPRDFEIPELDGDFPDLQKWFDKNMRGNNSFPPDVRERLGDLFKRFPGVHGRTMFPPKDSPQHPQFGTPSSPGTPGMFQESTSMAESRWIQDGTDITVKDVNGFRTVTVEMDGKVLAKDLPIGEIKSLPKEIREKILSLSDGIATPNAGQRPKLPGLEFRPRNTRRRL